MTLVIGRLSRFGLHKAVLLVPIMLAWPMLTPVPWIPKELLDKVNALLATHHMTLAEALDKASPSSSSSSSSVSPLMSDVLLKARLDTTYLTWIAVFFFVGSIVPVLLVPLLMRKRAGGMGLELQEHTRSESMTYTVTITVLSAGATYYFLNHPKQTAGSFMIATILVLTQVGAEVQWKPTIQRVLGTLGGVLLMFVVTAAVGGRSYVEFLGVPIPGTLYLIGVLFGMLAIVARFSPRQWIYFVLIAPATACLNAFSFDQADALGKQRLADNLVGALLVILAALITLAASRLAQTHASSGSSVVVPAGR